MASQRRAEEKNLKDDSVTGQQPIHLVLGSLLYGNGRTWAHVSPTSIAGVLTHHHGGWRMGKRGPGPGDMQPPGSRGGVRHYTTTSHCVQGHGGWPGGTPDLCSTPSCSSAFMGHFYCTVYGCFHDTGQSWIAVTEMLQPTEPEVFAIQSLQKTFANL